MTRVHVIVTENGWAKQLYFVCSGVSVAKLLSRDCLAMMARDSGVRPRWWWSRKRILRELDSATPNPPPEPRREQPAGNHYAGALRFPDS